MKDTKILVSGRKDVPENIRHFLRKSLPGNKRHFLGKALHERAKYFLKKVNLVDCVGLDILGARHMAWMHDRQKSSDHSQLRTEIYRINLQ